MNTVLSLFLMMSLSGHPQHVSFTNIDIDQAHGEVNLSIRMHTDDLKVVVFHLYEEQISIETDRELGDNHIELIRKYLGRVFTLWSGTDTINLEYDRKEQRDDFIWLYLKGSLPNKAASSFWLTNMILLDLYEDQTNLVILSNGRKEQGYTFNYQVRRLEMSINKE